MIMRHAHLSDARNRNRPVVISSAMLDALMSSNSTDDMKFSVKDGSNSLAVPSTTDNKLSAPDDNKSALIFTPSQLHKVHKRKKDTKPTSLSKKSSCTPILEALEISRSTDDGTSPTKTSGRTYDRDRSSESRRTIVMQESRRSTHKSERDLDSGLDSYRSREEYSPSPTRSSLTNSRPSASSRKSSALTSSNSTRKSEPDSDSDDETQNSSIYVTPEGTPFSMKSRESEERRNSRFKRSLSDEHNDESHSANSSFNNSGYYTPDSSPSKFNSAKRPKIRWSDTSTFSQDKSSYSSWRHNMSCNSDQGVLPELIGYQMVGDSQFCRFGQQLLGLERMPMPNCPGRIGICISGQTITDLHRRVKDNFYPISDKIILMIGTNDFLRNVDVSTMCEELSALIKTLQKSASNIILLTLPPIPKLEKKNVSHFKLLDVYNSHIRGLGNGETLRIADVSPLYMTSPPFQRCKMHLFEVFFGGPAKRLDLIHLNRFGLEIIRKYILDKFL